MLSITFESLLYTLSGRQGKKKLAKDEGILADRYKAVTMATKPKIIKSFSVRDIRFPTSLSQDGSDAMHTDPDYSCAYLILFTDTNLKGHGFTFTLGRGTEIVVAAVESLARLVVGQKLQDIFDDFGTFWHRLANDTQMRWIGPEKGVIHLAAAAVINALWDLWAKMENKPLWRLLVDLTPEQLVSTIDFTYLSDVLTKKEALAMLKENEGFKPERLKAIIKKGYPAYTTNVGWIGYPTPKIQQLCKDFLAQGFTSFKIKVGQSLEDDRRRCAVVREIIGWDNQLMLDANQRWEVPEAISWMKQLAEFKPLWIEEPTSPDDIAGHAEIARALNPLGISVATGEQCHNRVMFKQFLAAGAMQYCQIDSCRVGGVNENLAILLLAAKLKVPVCPHAGGVGLCELVQHLQFFDYICLTGTSENRMIEYVDHLHQHFKNPVVIKNAHYVAPQSPGYSTSMWKQSLSAYQFPNGQEWQKLFQEGKYRNPSVGIPDWIENHEKQAA